MWLDATAWASRKPGKPAVALFTASTAALARTRPRGVTATASTPSRRTGVRSCRRTTDLLGGSERLAGLDRVVRPVELRLARRHDERRRRAVPGVHAFPLAPVADPVHAALGRPDHVECPIVTDPVAENGHVVPERRDEAAVAPARPVPRKARVQHEHVASRLDRLQLPGGPEPEVPAADHDHVRGRVTV